MRFKYRAVERIPDNMEFGIVYHNKEFEIAGLQCACGCGHSITLIVPDSHEVYNEGGYATIFPSIGVLDGKCKSHYLINAGHVTWLPAFSSARASQIMSAQIARHAERDASAVMHTNKLRARIGAFVSKLKKTLGW